MSRQKPKSGESFSPSNLLYKMNRLHCGGHGWFAKQPISPFLLITGGISSDIITSPFMTVIYFTKGVRPYFLTPSLLLGLNAEKKLQSTYHSNLRHRPFVRQQLR
ncbi:hypothetical protein CEXT_365401 [Caerostris extrusa]|uniref:Uncharacterized protein n=1 Tax=Caerostris extrusa TaxID=172846 RepID=A0AAV4PXJ5_CAEEX|nr:hypothetical protein CEXT_365401 [Caerostris extrusa]